MRVTEDSSRLVWWLAGSGLLAGMVIVASVTLASWKMQHERADLLRQESLIVGAEQEIDIRLDRLRSLFGETLHGRFAGAQADLVISEIDQILDRVEDRSRFTGVTDPLHQLKTAVSRLNSECADSFAWAVAHNRQELEIDRSLMRAELEIRKLREVVETAEGRRRLERILRVRRFQNMSEEERHAVPMIWLMGGATERLAGVKTELADLRTLCQRIIAERDSARLVSLRDNKLAPTIGRMDRELGALDEQSDVEQIELRARYEEVLRAILGTGYRIETAHQTIRPGVGGLYSGCRERLRLRKLRTNRFASAIMALDECRSTLGRFTDVIRVRARELTARAEQSIRNAWQIVIGVGILTSFVFVLLAKRIAQSIDSQYRLIHDSNLALESAVEEAKLANLAKSQFLANMSHEIRTPMTAILGFTDVLVEECWGRPKSLETLKILKRNGHHLLQIINDILDLSKIEAGRFEIERIRWSPLSILAEVQSLMQVRIAGRNLQLEFEFEGPIVDSFETDPTRLRQILLNLVGNAVKFTESGTVHVVTRMVDLTTAEPQIEFKVIDTGIGMTAGAVNNLFTPFTQADNSMARRFGGTGLGLTISKRLAELMDGDITVTSVQGNGSEFTLVLPANFSAEMKLVANPLDSLAINQEPIDRQAIDRQDVAPDVAEPRELDDTVPSSLEEQVPLQGSETQVSTTRPSEARLATAVPPISLKGYRLLLAEDGPDNQRLISFILKKAGAEVDVAENGEIAVRLAEDALANSVPFDAILMDMQMPILDGYSATRFLRTRGYRRPIIALTAHAMSGDRQKCLEAGCDDYETKPIHRDRLFAVIRRLVESREFADATVSQPDV